MCLMSAPAAKNPGILEPTTRTLTAGSASARSSAACRPSMIGSPSALAGGRSSTMLRIPSPAASHVTTGSVSPSASVIGPAHRAGRQHVAAERASEDALHVAAGREQQIEVDSGLDAHLVQHRQQVLGRDVPRRAGWNRAPAELAEARLEAVDARVECGDDVGEALAARVVEVRSELHPGEAVACGAKEVADLARIGHPGGVAEAELVCAGGGDPLGQVEHAIRIDMSLIGAAEGDGDHGLAA